jgi:carbon monoxide dehydrogenase subunit G
VAQIQSAAVVPASQQEVFAFLSDLANHWRLMDGGVEVVDLDEAAQSGVVRLRGPLGMHRTVRTKVTDALPPRLLVGTATVGTKTRARVTWTLSEEPAGTQVRLVAAVEQATLLDRSLLALGGRTWLRRRFAFGLERLAARFAQPASNASTVPAARRAHASTDAQATRSGTSVGK